MPTLTQLEKDALHVHTETLRLELTARHNSLKAEYSAKYAEQKALAAIFEKRIKALVLDTVKSQFAPTIENLASLGIPLVLGSKCKTNYVEAVTYDRLTLTGLTFQVLLAPKTAVDILEKDLFKSRPRSRSFHAFGPSNFPMHPAEFMDDALSAMAYGRPQRHTKRDTSDFHHGQTRALMEYLMFSGPMDFDPEILSVLSFQALKNSALISKEHVYTFTKTDLEEQNAILAYIPVLKALDKQVDDIEQRLSDLPKLERIFTAAIAEQNLSNTDAGRDLLAQIASPPLELK
jgi:hypothetical protein